MKMKLYLLTQNVNTGYDTYDSCVVAAENEDAARLINPDGKWHTKDSEHRWVGQAWCYSPSDVGVEYIGDATVDTEAGIIVSSFNAG